jgi:hypothetical protein
MKKWEGRKRGGGGLFGKRKEISVCPLKLFEVY